MVQFAYYLNNDWFKIGGFGEKHVKLINSGLLGIIIIIFSHHFNIPFFFTFLFDNLLLNKLSLTRQPFRLH